MSYISCPVCGRRIVTSGEGDGATAPSFCPACGASLMASATAAEEPVSAQFREDDDSATRPVLIDELPTRRVEPAPAGAPTPGVDAAPAAAPDDGATRDLPASALPQPPQPPGSRLAGAGRVLGVVALVALLLVVVAAAALLINGGLPFGQQAATPTATATLAPTATPTTKSYTRAGLYQITYPNTWLNQEQNNPPTTYHIVVYNPQGGASVSITAQQVSLLTDPATNDTNYLNGLAASTGTKATNLSDPQAITLAGQTWTQESADVAIQTPAGKQYAHAVAMSVNHGGYLYTIVRLVPVSNPSEAASAFADADQASFQPILASFAFLG